MMKFLAALLLLVPLAGCVSTGGGSSQSPADPSSQQQDSERHRDLGAD